MAVLFRPSSRARDGESNATELDLRNALLKTVVPINCGLCLLEVEGYEVSVLIMEKVHGSLSQAVLREECTSSTASAVLCFIAQCLGLARTIVRVCVRLAVRGVRRTTVRA